MKYSDRTRAQITTFFHIYIDRRNSAVGPKEEGEQKGKERKESKK